MVIVLTFQSQGTVTQNSHFDIWSSRVDDQGTVCLMLMLRVQCAKGSSGGNGLSNTSSTCMSRAHNILCYITTKLPRTSPLTHHPSHFTSHTSHLTPHASHITPHTYTSPLTPHTLPLTPHLSPLTPHLSHLTPHTSHLTHHTSPLTPGSP